MTDHIAEKYGISGLPWEAEQFGEDEWTVQGPCAELRSDYAEADARAIAAVPEMLEILHLAAHVDLVDAGHRARALLERLQGGQE